MQLNDFQIAKLYITLDSLQAKLKKIIPELGGLNDKFIAERFYKWLTGEYGTRLDLDKDNPKPRFFRSK